MEIKTKNADVRTIVRESNQLIQLVDLDKTRELLNSVAEKHAGTQITAKNFDEGKLIRAEIREYRYALQNIEKQNAKILNEARRENKKLMAELIEIIRPTEDELDRQIKEVEAEKERLKKEREEREIKRVAEINKRLNEYRFELQNILQYGRTRDDVKRMDDKLTEIEDALNSDEFQEFSFEAQNILSEFSEKKLELESSVSEYEAQNIHNSRKAELASVWMYIKNPEMFFGNMEQSEFDKLKNEAIAEREAVEAKEREEKQRREKEKQELEQQRRELERQKKEFEAEMKRAREEKEKQEAEERRKIEAKELQERLERERIEAEKQVEKEREVLKAESRKYGIKVSGKSNETLKAEIRAEKDKIDREQKEALNKEAYLHLKEIDTRVSEVLKYISETKLNPIHKNAVNEFKIGISNLFTQLEKELIN